MRFTTRDYHQGREEGCPACRRDFDDCQCDRYCYQCGTITNHSPKQHHEAQQAGEGEE